MGRFIRSINGRSIKPQWYVLYCIVLVIPILTMVFSYRYSYEQLAETVYDRQMAHLTLVRDLVDAEARNLSNAMMAFGVDSQIREAVKVKEPAAEGTSIPPLPGRSRLAFLLSGSTAAIPVRRICSP